MELFVKCYWLLVIGYSLNVIGYWLLVIGEEAAAGGWFFPSAGIRFGMGGRT